jgi:hypothetical protein
MVLGFCSTLLCVCHCRCVLLLLSPRLDRFGWIVEEFFQCNCLLFRCLRGVFVDIETDSCDWLCVVYITAYALTTTCC